MELADGFTFFGFRGFKSLTRSGTDSRVLQCLSRRLIIGAASVAYTGFSPFAPGTVATALVAFLFWLGKGLAKGTYNYGLLVLGLLFLGWWLADRAEEILGEKDSPRIVVDEMAGFLVAMVALPRTMSYLAAAFVLFRLFDIWKVFPTKLILARMEGGLAIIIDDVIAGIYANLVLQLLRHVPF